MAKIIKNALKPKFIWQIAILLVIIACLYLAVSLYFRNYAMDVAEPFDKALLEKGSTKKCEQTSNGFAGVDDKHPGYNAFYETSMNRNEAADFINAIATKNSFKLKHAQIGDLPIPDIYISNYYFDHSSKQNQFFPLKDGSTELTFELVNSGNIDLNGQACGEKADIEVRNDDKHTAVRLDVKLPEVK